MTPPGHVAGNDPVMPRVAISPCGIAGILYLRKHARGRDIRRGAVRRERQRGTSTDGRNGGADVDYAEIAG